VSDLCFETRRNPFVPDTDRWVLPQPRVPTGSPAALGQVEQNLHGQPGVTSGRFTTSE